METLLRGDPDSSPTSVAKAIMNTAKSSAGPKPRARSASGSAKNVKSTDAMTAPKSEEVNASVSARPGFPSRFAMGNPSKSSATDQGSPGMLKRIDVTTPPKTAPQ